MGTKELVSHICPGHTMSRTGGTVLFYLNCYFPVFFFLNQHIVVELAEITYDNVTHTTIFFYFLLIQNHLERV